MRAYRVAHACDHAEHAA